MYEAQRQHIDSPNHLVAPTAYEAFTFDVLPNDHRYVLQCTGKFIDVGALAAGLIKLRPWNGRA